MKHVETLTERHKTTMSTKASLSLVSDVHFHQQDNHFMQRVYGLIFFKFLVPTFLYFL